MRLSQLRLTPNRPCMTLVSYKPLSDSNFARNTGQYGSYIPSSPLGSISPWYNFILGCVQSVDWTGGLINFHLKTHRDAP